MGQCSSTLEQCSSSSAACVENVLGACLSRTYGLQEWDRLEQEEDFELLPGASPSATPPGTDPLQPLPTNPGMMNDIVPLKLDDYPEGDSFLPASSVEWSPNLVSDETQDGPRDQGGRNDCDNTIIDRKCLQRIPSALELATSPEAMEAISPSSTPRGHASQAISPPSTPQLQPQGQSNPSSNSSTAGPVASTNGTSSSPSTKGWMISPPLTPDVDPAPHVLQIKKMVKINAEDSLREVHKLEGWKLLDKRDARMQLYTKDYGDLIGVKAICQVDASCAAIVDCIMTEKLSKQSSKPRLIEQVTDDLSVYWMGVKAPIVKDRDFVIAEWNCRQPNDVKFMQTFCSVEHPLGPIHPKKKYVRGKILMGAWHVDPSAPHVCMVTWVSVVDPAGTLPSAIKKMGAPTGADAVLRLKELAEKRMANGSFAHV